MFESGQLYFPVSEDEIVMTMTRNDQDFPAMLLGVSQVAKILGVSPRTVYRMADAGKMPRPRRLNTLIRYSRQEIGFIRLFGGLGQSKALTL